MSNIRTVEQFYEVLDLARSVRRARSNIEDFERNRLAAYPKLIQDWQGGARTEFDTHWNTTAVSYHTVIGFQFPGWEEDLVGQWVTAVDQHNHDAYRLALHEAGGAIDQEEDLYRRSAALSTGIDTEAIASFNEQPQDRVHHATVIVGRPTEASDYAATASFIHYVRQSDNTWFPELRNYPNRDALEMF